MTERGKACTPPSGHYSQAHPRSSLGERNETSIDALHRGLNKPSATPQSTVEAIMVAVRERGLAALKDAANVERLHRCDRSARAQINERITRLYEQGSRR
jgi:hypothetical protein